MTDEERQKLIAALRQLGNPKQFPRYPIPSTCADAADEIERLANAEAVWKERAKAYLKIANDEAALAQSDAEPEYHPDGRRKGRSRLVYDKEKRTIVPESSQSDAEPVAWRWREAQPFYAVPPCPDASAGHGHSLIKGDRGGISWGGSFYVEGNRESIDAVRAAHDAQERCKYLDKMIAEKQLVRPDASAGLIEAACLLDKRADDYTGLNEKIEQGYRMGAKYLREIYTQRYRSGQFIQKRF